jgi:peroxiredoxin
MTERLFFAGNWRNVSLLCCLLMLGLAAERVGAEDSLQKGATGRGNVKAGAAASKTFAANSRAADASPDTSATNDATAHDPSLLVRLIRSRALKDELRLKPAACQAIDKVVAEVEYPLFQLRDYPVEKKRERLNALSEAVETALDQALTAAERQRLVEIQLRAHGWPALLAPQPAQALGLSADQTATIRQILESAAKSDKPATASPDEQIQKLLTPEQKNELRQMVGRPFDFSKVKQVASLAPELRDVTDWVNTKPVTLADLRGQVVALHFFAFGCSNCVNNQPHYKAWHERYADKGVTVLGIHTPETARERDVANLKADAKTRKLVYPIAVDGKASNWDAWSNHMWPSVYLIDKRGYVRYWWYGELNWQGAAGEETMRRRIDELLAEKE